MSGSRGSRTGLGAEHAVDHALLVLSPLVVLLSLRHFLSLHVIAIDFRDAYWWAGHQVLHGRSPYHPSAGQIASAIVFVYPPLAALLFAPLALLPASLAGVLFTVFCVVCLGLALRIVGVRGWRVYAAVAIWSPVVTAWQAANLTLPFALGLALVWRYRDRPVVVGALVAVLVSIKPFVWPLGLWLLATRRHRAVVVAVAGAAIVNLAGFAIIGIDQLQALINASNAVIKVLRGMGYGVESVVSSAGLAFGLGEAAMIALAVIVAVLIVRAGRAANDQAGFALSVLLMLVASPIVDFHYFALLAVPLAVAHPRLRVVWLVPLLLWLCPAYKYVGWAGPLWWALAIGVVAVAATQSRASRDTTPAPLSPLRAPMTPVL